ncbi:MAG: DUF4296 domain-containing protein [Bacteroidota bacterium]
MRCHKGLFYLFFLLILSSCANDERPSWVLGHDQMVAMMKEMYLADAVVQEYKGNIDDKRMLREELHKGILEQFQVERSLFYESYEFYVDHPFLLDTITNQVVEELNAQIPVEKEKVNQQAVEKLRATQDSIAQQKLKAGESSAGE